MSDNTVETTQTAAAEPGKSDKPDKVRNSLILVITDEVREEVDLLIADAKGERDLLAQAGMKRTSRVEHASRILRALGCITDGTDESGNPVQVWTGFPKWTNGKDATFSDIARQIVPNTDNVVYAGSTDKARKAGTLTPEALDYSRAVDAVAGSLKDAAGKAGRKGQTRTTRNGSGEADKQDKSVNSGQAGIDPTTVDADELVKTVIMPFLDKLTASVKSGELPILPDTAALLASKCSAYAAAMRAAQKPATQAKRTVPAKR